MTYTQTSERVATPSKSVEARPTTVSDLPSDASRQADASRARALHEELFARLETAIGEIWSTARAGRFWAHVQDNGLTDPSTDC